MRLPPLLHLSWLPRLAPYRLRNRLRIPHRLRIIFRCAFLLLAGATAALALYVLQQEKQLSYKNYQRSFYKTKEQLVATLRHPSGQLALLNPHVGSTAGAALSPVLLPYSALDFDDRDKVQQAAEMSGCLIQYPQHGALCVAIGNDPWAGGFIYVVGKFASPTLVPHRRGDFDLNQAHRVRASVTLRGQTYRWVAPFETTAGTRSIRSAGVQGRLTGFTDDPTTYFTARPVRDFRGWVWQSARCIESERDGIDVVAAVDVADRTDADCARDVFFSLRLPIGILQDELFQNKLPVWPPADLGQIKTHIEVLAPGDGAALLDSQRDPATAPFSLGDLAPLLLPGETLRVHKAGKQGDAEIARLVGVDQQADQHTDDAWQLLTNMMTHLIKRLPVTRYDIPLEASERITTPAGAYEVLLKGDVRSVNQSLSAVATRVSWFVGAMLLAIFLVWLVIETSIVRRIARLTRRAASLSKTVKGAGALDTFDLSDLRGRDELGVLAGCLHTLLRRVKEDVERERIRAERERDMWHAVGHEIMSPLQSLMALHGSASPSEAFQSTDLQVSAIDLSAFLRNVAANAPQVGIADVRFDGDDAPLMVRADDYSLEDVVTHVLRNAERFRVPGSVIAMRLQTTETAAVITIHNQGPHIAADMIDKIFEYGVSDQHDAGAYGNRGQGLFVAKTYMAKMGGTITAVNEPDGVSFVLNLQRVTVG